MAVKLQDNHFDFNLNGLTEVAFQERDHSITNGQPYNGVSCSGTRLTVQAGRHNSVGVADWFKTNTSGGGGIALTYSDTAPDDLNFAVRGTLTLKIAGIYYTAQNFILGQGHSGTSNNWWIGSATMSAITHTNVDQQYAETIVKATLKYAVDIITENPLGAVEETAKLIVKAIKKHKSGSGQIAFTTSQMNNAVELLLFQMDNSDTNASLTGTYVSP
jgi:hypothetical protein